MKYLISFNIISSFKLGTQKRYALKHCPQSIKAWHQKHYLLKLDSQKRYAQKLGNQSVTHQSLAHTEMHYIQSFAHKEVAFKPFQLSHRALRVNINAFRGCILEENFFILLFIT
jgi:hypothetical protein